MERWLSGRKRLIANPFMALNGHTRVRIPLSPKRIATLLLILCLAKQPKRSASLFEKCSVFFCNPFLEPFRAPFYLYLVFLKKKINKGLKNYLCLCFPAFNIAPFEQKNALGFATRGAERLRGFALPSLCVGEEGFQAPQPAVAKQALGFAQNLRFWPCFAALASSPLGK